MIALALGLGLAVLSTGCGQDNDVVVVDEPPLRVSVAFPVDLPTPYRAPAAISVTFNRPAGHDEIEVSIFPLIATGEFAPNNSASGRAWTWKDVQFDPADGCYFWLIDGVNLGRYYDAINGDTVFLREPVMIRIPSSLDRLPSVGFGGSVTSFKAAVIASGTLLFTLPLDSGFNALDPGTFNPDTALAIAVAGRGDDNMELPGFFNMTMLPDNTPYIVVAVKDTNNDLAYTPLDDWWGVWKIDGSVAVVRTAENTGEKDSPYNAAIDIVLEAPVPAAN
ncbi:hypothetical protein DRQ53_00725 [bacterium]|nr:MAG: hypothetical protein DRQ53_00725 [bacterium]